MQSVEDIAAFIAEKQMTSLDHSQHQPSSLDDWAIILVLKQKSIELKTTKALLEAQIPHGIGMLHNCHIAHQNILQQHDLLRNEIAELGFDTGLVQSCDDQGFASMVEMLTKLWSEHQSGRMPRTRATQEGPSPAEPPVPPASVHAGQQTERGAGWLLALGIANSDDDMNSPLEGEVEVMCSIIEPVDDLVPKVRSPILPATVQIGQGAKRECGGGLGRGRSLTAEGGGNAGPPSVSLAASTQSGLSSLLPLMPGLVKRNSHKHGSSGTMEVADGGAPMGVVPVSITWTSSVATATDASPSGSLASGAREGREGSQCADESSRWQLRSLGPHDTTLMVRNIPARYTQETLLEEWPPNGKYNFLHLPYSLKDRRALGFVFINFTSHANALEFQRNWHGRFFTEHGKTKYLDIAAADIQGSRANLEKLRGKREARLSSDRFLPVLFDGTSRLDTRDALRAMMVERTRSGANAGSSHTAEHEHGGVGTASTP